MSVERLLGAWANDREQLLGHLMWPFIIPWQGCLTPILVDKLYIYLRGLAFHLVQEDRERVWALVAFWGMVWELAVSGRLIRGKRLLVGRLCQHLGLTIRGCGHWWTVGLVPSPWGSIVIDGGRWWTVVSGSVLWGSIVGGRVELVKNVALWQVGWGTNKWLRERTDKSQVQRLSEMLDPWSTFFGWCLNEFVYYNFSIIFHRRSYFIDGVNVGTRLT